jgi:ABC-2 type transport system ATP-binding protein
LMGDGKVLFLDEPTTDMDPLAAREFRTLIGELRAEGRTILLATHDMAEAETVCDRVTLIDRGKIIATESPRTLGGLLTRFQRIDVEQAPEPVLAEIRALRGVTSVTVVDGSGTRIEVDEEGVTQLVLEHLVGAGVTSVRTSLPNLEEVYVQLIGERGMDI